MKNTKKPKGELFRLAKNVWNGLTFEDVIETSSAMKELDLFHPPTSIFDIECPSDAMSVYADDGVGPMEHEILDQIICHYNLSEPPVDNHFDITFVSQGKYLRMTHASYPNYFKEDVLRGVYNNFYIFLIHVLIVVLASRNIEKRPRVNDARSRNHQEREDSKKYDLTTTIKIGAITEYIGSNGNSTGRTMRPHLRRGHIKNVRVGEGRKETKKVFIQPCFVNADKDWLATPRKSYNVVSNGQTLRV
jgi:hypothetical protein